MKHLKILGLAAVAALALMAFVGAGTASAETTLCTVTEDACSTANMMGPGTGMEKISTSLEGEAILKAGFGTVKCKKSTVEGNVETTTTPEGKIAKLTFEECNCIVTVIKPGTLVVHWDAEHNGNLTVLGFLVEVNCTNVPAMLNQHCWYGGNITAGITVLGGSPAKVNASEASVPIEALQENTGLCGTNGKWTATYKVNEPTALFVSKGL